MHVLRQYIPEAGMTLGGCFKVLRSSEGLSGLAVVFKTVQLLLGKHNILNATKVVFSFYSHF